MRKAVVNYVKWVIERFPYDEPILDTCAGWEPNYYQPLFPGKRYVKQDFQDYDPPCVDIVCDVSNMKPITDESFGLVLNLEALEHIAFPQKAIDEIHRILRPEGLLVLTTVMYFRIHPSPKDYWRFTPDGIELLLRQFKILDCTLEGSLKKPKGVWVTARKTGSPEEWGKLPSLKVSGNEDHAVGRVKRKLGSLMRGREK